MSNPVFLIDLASARPATPPPTEHWAALAKEHGNQLTRCIRRIIAHSNVKSVTTHLFDSTALTLTHAGKLSAKPIKDALEDLNRIPAQVANLDITGVKYPTARGVLAGLTDAAPEDNFSEFYPEPKSRRDVYVFSRAPATRAALAAFIGKKELALSSLERGLADSPYLPNVLKKFTKLGDRLVWVNSTPRRCERVGDVHPEVEKVFSDWLLSFSSEFRFVNLHSFLLDRRIVPAKTIVGSLWDGSVGNDLGLGKLVEVLCLQDSQLLRCFSACMNVLGEGVAEEKTSQITLVLSGCVRNYGTEELTRFGAFDTPAHLVTPAPNLSGDDPRSLNSSNFAGLMVDLARRNMCLIADCFEVDETDGFKRYQTLLQPITPLSAVLRKVSRTEAFVNYDSSCLPQSIEEWRSWDKLENVKDCDITDSVIDASAKFFETYLPDLFSTPGRDNTGLQGADTAKQTSKKVKMSQNDHMLLSFEGGTALLPANSQDKFTVFFEGMGRAPKVLKRDRVTGPKVIDRDLIMQQLRAQQDVPPEKKPQESPKTTPIRQAQMQSQQKVAQTNLKTTPQKRSHTPQNSNRNKKNKIGHTSAGNKFEWSTPSQVVAPSDGEIQKCIDVHMHNKNGFRSPEAVCKNKEKKVESAPRAPEAVVRSKSIVHAGLSPTTPEDGCHERSVSDGRPECNVALLKTRKIVADPEVLQFTSDSGSCSPEPAKTRGLSDRKQSSSSVGEDKVTQSKKSIDESQKRKLDVLVNQELESLKRLRSLSRPPTKAGEDLKFECEWNHGKFVRDAVQAFSGCLDKLRTEDSDPTETIVWECVTLLSCLAEALSFHHKLQCDMDRIINLNLKIPRAVTEAVQAVHNEIKNDDFSPKVVLREMWETILNAFEQAMWHLASARRVTINKPSKKRVRRQVHEVSKILTCTQFMAEITATSRSQPVSFRNVFSKLFSSVFVHLCRKDSGEPIPEIVSLFEKFEQTLPTPLQAANGGGKTNEAGADAIQKRTYPRTGSAPSQTEPLLVGSSRNTNSSIRPRKDPLDGKMSSKTTTERNRAAQMEPSTIVARARKSMPRITLGRPQFARESEALRNAMNSQTRLPLQSTKSGIKNKSRSKGTDRSVSQDAPDRSTLQDILASTVPAPVIDVPSADEPDEDSVEQTPPPRIQNKKDGKVVETTPDIKDASVEDIADAGVGQAGSSIQQEKQGNHEQKEASAKEEGKQGTLVKEACEKIEPRSDLNRLLPRATRSRGREVTSGQQHVDMDSTLSADEVTPTKANRVARKKNSKGKEPDNQHGTVSRSARPVTRRQASQVLAEEIEEEQASIDASPESSRRLTRSQAKQKTRKRRLEMSPPQKESSPRSPRQKKRRRKQISAQPKLPRASENVPAYESSPTSSSPTTRSQATAAKKKSSLQLRNRSVNRTRRLATVKPTTREVVADAAAPTMKEPIEDPKTPAKRPRTPTGNMLSPAPLGSVTPSNVLSPETPVAKVRYSQENTALHRIVNSSLEKRKGKLGEEDFIPETPIPPKSSAIIPPSGRSVRRTLFGNE